MIYKGVYLVQRIIPSYRVGIFRRLNEIGVCVVASNIERSGVVGVNIDDPGFVYVPYRAFSRSRNIIYQKVSPILSRYKKVVIAEYSIGNMTFWYLLLRRMFGEYKLIAWSQGVRNVDMVRESCSFHMILARVVSRLVDGIIVYSEQRRDRFVGSSKYLARKVFVARNTLELSEGVNLTSSVREQPSYRKYTNSDLTLVFIGRYKRDKRLDLLYDSLVLLRRKYNVRLHLIGKGQLPKSEQFCTDDSVIDHGPIYDESALSEILSLCDVMVIPGYVGLSIIHGYYYSIPIVTCKSTLNGPFHSPEIEYLKDGYNGFFCDSTPESIAACIERLILDPEFLARMKANALETVRTEANVERMIDGFRQAIDYVTRDDKR